MVDHSQHSSDCEMVMFAVVSIISDISVSMILGSYLNITTDLRIKNIQQT